MEYIFYSIFLLIPFGFLVYKWFVIDKKIEFITKAFMVNFGIAVVAYFGLVIIFYCFPVIPGKVGNIIFIFYSLFFIMWSFLTIRKMSLRYE